MSCCPISLSSLTDVCRFLSKVGCSKISLTGTHWILAQPPSPKTNGDIIFLVKPVGLLSGLSTLGTPLPPAIDMVSTISAPRMPRLPSLASFMDALSGHGLVTLIGRMDCAICLCIRFAQAAYHWCTQSVDFPQDLEVLIGPDIGGRRACECTVVDGRSK
jgi:hypothetical protein